VSPHREHRPGTQEPAEDGGHQPAFSLANLRERRIVQFLVAYAAGGWAVLGVVDQLVDRGILPGAVYRVALALLLCGLPGALILSWFHGARGAQKAPTIEKWLLGIVAVLSLGAAFAVARSDVSPAASEAAGPVELKPNEDPRRVAVLYFDTQGGGDDAEFLATGLTESLIDELSTVKALKVVSRNGSELYRHQRPPMDSIGRALGVGTIVDGKVAVAGDRVRVNVSMIDASDGSQFQSTSFDRKRADLFDLQDTLSLQVADFLRRKIGQEMGQIELRRTTHSVEAWELLQQASVAGERATEAVRRGDVPGASRELVQADSILARAEQADPSWVEPITRRGWLAYRQSRLGGFDRSQYGEWISIGLARADSALALAPDDPSALELKGTLLYWKYLLNLYDDEDQAQSAFSQAEALLRKADTPSARASLSHLLLNEGETAQAKIAAQSSYDADPFLENANLTVWRLTRASWDLGDSRETARWCNEGLRRFPDDYRFHQCQLMLYALPDVPSDIPAAWEDERRFVELSPPQIRTISEKQGLQYMAMALVRADLPDSARAVAVRGRASPSIDPLRDIALLESIPRCWLGDWDEAVRLMGLYLAANPSTVAAYKESVAKGQVYWYHEGLQNQPRFRALLGLN
jgi:TolB-like protein